MQNINVNIVPDNFPQTIRYSQGDIGRQFKINVADFDIPVGATVKIQATKPSGLGFSVAGVVSDNSVTFTTTEEMTDEAGRFQAELQITAGGDVIGTANFLMIGERNPHPEGTTDGSQGTIIPELTLLVERVEKAASDILDMEVVATTLPAGSQATYSYDEDLNKATFGIPEGQAGAGAAGVVASAYSAAKTYKVGDYVLYNSNLYRCTTAITTAEAWTAAHWTQVVLADDVTDLKTDLYNIEGTGRNLFDSEQLLEASGWSVNDGDYSGILSDLLTRFSKANGGFQFKHSSFKPNTQYVISLNTYNEGSGSSGNGFMITVQYTDGTETSHIYMGNNWKSWTARTTLTTLNKTVSKIFLTPNAYTTYKWHIKDFSIVEGNTILGLNSTTIYPYDKYYATAKDNTARKITDSFFMPLQVEYVIANYTYTNNAFVNTTTNARISTAKPYHLLPNDIIKLTDYSNARMWVSWLNKDGISRTLDTWITADFTVYEEADYLVVVARPYNQEVVLTDPSVLGDLLQIIHQTSAVELEQDVATKYGLETIPSYYTDYPTAIVNARGDIASAGYDGFAFLFTTDNHWEVNRKVSPILIKDTLHKLNLNELVLGGDLMDGGAFSPSRAEGIEHLANAFEAFNFGKNVLYVMGNHDTNTVGQSAYPERYLSNKDVYGICMRQMENKGVVHPDFNTYLRMPYYWDIPDSKTRIVVADTATEGTPLYDSQINWLTSAMDSAPSGYHIIIFAHIWCENGSDEFGLQFATQGQQLITMADNFNSTHTDKKIVGMFGGHVHKDANYVTSTGINLILTDCDGMRTLSAEGNTPLTDTETCYDVITLNYSAKTINCRRIGRGSDRAFSWNY